MRSIIRRELQTIIQFSQHPMPLQTAIVLSLSTLASLLTGLYVGQFQLGLLASLANLAAIYLPSSSASHQLRAICICCAGFIIAFAIGSLIQPYPHTAIFVLTIFTVAAHWLADRLDLQQPKALFFTMVACVANAIPQAFDHILANTSAITLGCVYTLFFLIISQAVITRRKKKSSAAKLAKADAPLPIRQPQTNIYQSLIYAAFFGLAMLVAHLLNIPSGYWVGVSCATVMLGANSRHVFQRGIQRVTGTAIGVLICLYTLSRLSPLEICLMISLLNFLTPIAISKNYALGIIFVTPITVLLVIATCPHIPANEIIMTRFIDIALGSFIGSIGGYFLHHQIVYRRHQRSVHVS